MASCFPRNVRQASDSGAKSWKPAGEGSVFDVAAAPVGKGSAHCRGRGQGSGVGTAGREGGGDLQGHVEDLLHILE